MSSSKINSLSCQGIGSGSPFLILFIHIVLCLCSCFVCVEGFDSLLQLPQSLSETSRPRSKRVFFVTDFGARGDGISNDTQVILLYYVILFLIFFKMRNNYLIISFEWCFENGLYESFLLVPLSFQIFLLSQITSNTFVNTPMRNFLFWVFRLSGMLGRRLVLSQQEPEL